MATRNARGGWDISDEEAAEVIARSSQRKRNGQTAACCFYCGEEIEDVAYVVESRDAQRLLNASITANILHYGCIHLMFTPSELT